MMLPLPQKGEPTYIIYVYKYIYIMCLTVPCIACFCLCVVSSQIVKSWQVFFWVCWRSILLLMTCQNWPGKFFMVIRLNCHCVLRTYCCWCYFCHSNSNLFSFVLCCFQDMLKRTWDNDASPLVDLLEGSWNETAMTSNAAVDIHFAIESELESWFL